MSKKQLVDIKITTTKTTRKITASLEECNAFIEKWRSKPEDTIISINGYSKEEANHVVLSMRKRDIVEIVEIAFS